MVEFKFLLLLFSVHFTLVVANLPVKEYRKGEESCNLSKGQRSSQPQDSLLHSEVIVNHPPHEVYGTYCYPPSVTDDTNSPIVITMYEVLEIGNNDGAVREYSGGVGQIQVCVFIKVVQFEGRYKYEFNVYGYMRDQAAEAALKTKGTQTAKTDDKK